MSNKRHSHKVVGSNSGKKGGLFKGNVPKAPVERDEQGNFLRTADHVRGNGVYNPRKGWRVQRQYNPHALLNSLMMKLGLASMYQN